MCWISHSRMPIYHGCVASDLWQGSSTCGPLPGRSLLATGPHEWQAGEHLCVRAQPSCTSIAVSIAGACDPTFTSNGFLCVHMCMHTCLPLPQNHPFFSPSPGSRPPTLNGWGILIYGKYSPKVWELDRWVKIVQNNMDPLNVLISPLFLSHLWATYPSTTSNIWTKKNKLTCVIITLLLVVTSGMID